MNFDAEEMKILIVERVAENFTSDDTLWGMVKKRLDEKVERLFAERASAAITAAVDTAINEGFEREYCPVDAFGRKTGVPTTIGKEMANLIGGYWATRVDAAGKERVDAYNTTTRAEYVMAQMVAKDFTEQMRQASISATAAMKDGFRAQLAKQVDGILDELFRVKSLQDQEKAEKPW